MPKIQVDSDTWPNIVVAYLMDKILHPDDISENNEDFNDLMKKMKGKGMLPLFRNYYLSMDANWRMRYRIIKDGFWDETTTAQTIFINAKKRDRKDKKSQSSLIKKIIKKSIKAIIASKEYDDEEVQLLKEYLEEE